MVASTEPGQRVRRLARDFWISWLILGIGAAATLGVATWTRRAVDQRQQAAFQQATETLYQTVDLYFSSYYNILNGIKSAFARDALLTAPELKAYLESFGLRRDHADLSDVGFVQRIPRHEISTPAAATAPGSDPSTSPPPDLFSLVYWDDFRREDLTVPGGRPLQDPMWLETIARSVDTGDITCTPPLQVRVGESTNEILGFMFFVPVYRPGAPTETAEQRRAATLGLVSATFLAHQFWQNVLKHAATTGVDFEVYDGLERNRDHLWFDSDLLLRGTERPPGIPQPRFESVMQKGGIGRVWSFYFASQPARETTVENQIPLTMLLGGFGVTSALFALSLAQARSRQRAEDLAHQLHAAKALVETQKERLLVTLSAVDDGVIAADIEGRLAFMNRAAQELVGSEKAQWKGHTLHDVVETADPETGTALPCPLAEVLRSGQSHTPAKPVLLRAKDRPERLVSPTYAALRDGTGKVVGAVVVFRDVSERQRLLEEQIKTTKLESVGLLAGGIAHDFNNILTAILGNLSLAQLEAGTSSDLTRLLREAELACARARELTLQLLTFSKGGAPIRQTALLGDVIAESTRFATHGSNVRGICHLPPDLWPVEADKGQISQVLQNIVLNAVEAMPEGGRVEVRAENVTQEPASVPHLPPGRFVRITITDRGTGIRPEHLARVFDPYFSTKQRGSGLGLATAYSIVRRHEGHLRVESTLGAGSRFEILLPASPHAPTGTNPAPPSPPTGRGLILIMDDEPSVLNASQRMLERLGYEVAPTDEGTAAVRRFTELRAQGRSVTAVLLDLTVPGGLGGLATLKHLRELDPQLPAIVSSGYSTDPIMADHRLHGFQGVIPKPFSLDTLAQVLHEVVSSTHRPR